MAATEIEIDVVRALAEMLVGDGRDAADSLAEDMEEDVLQELKNLDLSAEDVLRILRNNPKALQELAREIATAVKSI